MIVEQMCRGQCRKFGLILDLVKGFYSQGKFFQFKIGLGFPIEGSRNDVGIVMDFNGLGVIFYGFGKLPAFIKGGGFHVGDLLSCLVIIAGRKFVQQHKGCIKVLGIHIGIQKECFDFFYGVIFRIGFHEAL